MIRADALAEARKWIGTPYHHQASRAGVGCDCLGLVSGVWRALYGDEPQTLPPYGPSLPRQNDELKLAFQRWLIETRWMRPSRVMFWSLPGAAANPPAIAA